MVEMTWLRFDIEEADIRPGSEIGPYGFFTNNFNRLVT